MKLLIGNKVMAEGKNESIILLARSYYKLMIEGKLDKQLIQLTTPTRTINISETEYKPQPQEVIPNV